MLSTDALHAAARMRALAALLVCAAGCDSGIELSVDLKTDLRPGTELAAVRTELGTMPIATATVGAPVQSVRATASASDDFVSGRRIAEFADLQRGTWYARVSLLDARDAVLVSRDVTLHIDASYATTVVVTRDCRGFTCPIAGGDPTLTACVGGRCIDPRCTPLTPEFCGDPVCTTDRVCTTAVACARPRCVERECFDVLDDALCAPGEHCDATRGCVSGGDAGPTPDGGRADAGRADAGGPPPGDAGPTCPAHETACTDGRDEDCDGQTDCADSDCNGVACDDGNACTHTDRCAASACAGTAITCTSDACVTRTCNGSASCTVSNAGAGAPCAADLNPCTADQCDGAGNCVAPGVPDGSMVFGGAYVNRCCGGVPVDISTDDGNCGGCGIHCDGRGCAILPGTFFPGCPCAVSNAQCQASMGPDATCYNRGSDADWYCNCQVDGDCAPGQVCAVVSGHNYCMY